MFDRPRALRPSASPALYPGSAWEVLLAFLRLGCTSFGGPIAHLAYFRTEFVERRRWLDDRHYGDLVALCQFLPGPASSQVGMALGLQRAGWAGALAAWVGFTLPSALALIGLAYGLGQVAADGAPGTWAGAVHGLHVVAVAVVAQAVWGMARTLCPDRLRAGLALAAALLVLVVPGVVGQLGALVLGAGLGRWRLVMPRPDALAEAGAAPGPARRAGAALLLVFVALLAALPLLAASQTWAGWSAIAVFYQAGALVFGGGHVVLPLLQAGVVPPGWISNDSFLAGYGAAQAMPGPLFTLAAYVGAAMSAPWGGWWGGLVLLLVIFLPAFLLVAGALPFWNGLRQRPGVQAAMGGTNAAVVGVLLAALYDPVWTSAIHTRVDFALALAAFGLLVVARWSPLAVVALAAAAGAVMGR